MTPAQRAALLELALSDEQPKPQQSQAQQQEKPKQAEPIVGGLLALTVLVMGSWGLGFWAQRTDVQNMVRQQRAVEEALKQEAMR